jgi:hypothetical protein
MKSMLAMSITWLICSIPVCAGNPNAFNLDLSAATTQEAPSVYLEGPLEFQKIPQTAPLLFSSVENAAPIIETKRHGKRKSKKNRAVQSAPIQPYPTEQIVQLRVPPIY